MSMACSDLDHFFDGELASERAAAFRDHLGGCVRCQGALHGRLQEAVIVDAQHDLRAPAIAVDRKRLRGRLVAILVPLLSAAAVAAVMLSSWHRASRDTPLLVELTVDHSGPVMRGTSAHPGDMLRVTAHGARYRAIWIYRDEHTLVAVCPGAPSCHLGADAIALELVLPGRGAYAVVSLSSASVLPMPTGDLDADLDAASTIDGKYKIGHLEVD